MHDLLSRDNLEAITDLKGVVREMASGVDFTETYVKDLAEIASLHANAARQNLRRLNERQRGAASAANFRCGSIVLKKPV